VDLCVIAGSLDSSLRKILESAQKRMAKCQCVRKRLANINTFSHKGVDGERTWIFAPGALEKYRATMLKEELPNTARYVHLARRRISHNASLAQASGSGQRACL
jgi:hypothetical protein